MRLLWFNLAMDLDDPILGFATRWVQAMAERVDSITVITMRAGRVEVPQNVRVFSVGQEKGYSKPRRALEFYRFLFRTLREERIDACFSHMIPIFTVMGTPALKIFRIPIVTWYAHPSLTWTLKLAHHLSDRMVASVPTAYPYKKDKLIAIGQGIDPDLFHPDSTLPEMPPIVLCVSRISPVKDQRTLIHAAGILHQKGFDFRVWIVGKVIDRGYFEVLQREVQKLGLDAIVQFLPPVPVHKLPEIYRKAWVHVNLTPTGFGDKVTWEAMACGRPSLAANEGYRDTLGPYSDLLLFRHGDPRELAVKLERILSFSMENVVSMGRDLSKRTLERHGLPGLMDRILNLLNI